jgi:hypothetical protein
MKGRIVYFYLYTVQLWHCSSRYPSFFDFIELAKGDFERADRSSFSPAPLARFLVSASRSSFGGVSSPLLSGRQAVSLPQRQPRRDPLTLFAKAATTGIRAHAAARAPSQSEELISTSNPLLAPCDAPSTSLTIVCASSIVPPPSSAGDRHELKHEVQPLFEGACYTGMEAGLHQRQSSPETCGAVIEELTVFRDSIDNSRSRSSAPRTS